MQNRNVVFTTTLFALAFLALWSSPEAFGVSPAPDGGYPGGNTAEGTHALFSLGTGGYNTAVGYFSLRSNTTNSFNTAIGAGTLLANTADVNTATGAGALLSNTTGPFNTANGAFALFGNTTGYSNTAVGSSALISNTVGYDNTATGINALYSNSTGFHNTAIGSGALFSNTTADTNTAAGFHALFSNSTGGDNTANGDEAHQNNTVGLANTAIGSRALFSNSTGGDNTALGFEAGVGVTTAHNVICIGANVGGANVEASCFIGNIRGVTTASPDAIPVLIDSAGQLGTMSSSRRFKKEIQPMDKASEAILTLRPVTFQYKSDETGTLQFGLIAEEVAEVNPDLVVRDKDGQVYTVRYDAVNAMLLNEFLKEHRKLKQLEKQVETLTAGLQKVNAEIEMSKAIPKVVCNDP